MRNGLDAKYTNPAKYDSVVYVRYQDHVLYNRTFALTMKPQVREAIGWLVYECAEYITLAWDQDAEPPTLKGGDPKASGLILLKSDILDLRHLQVTALPLQKNSNNHLNCPKPLVKSEYALRPTERKTQSITKEKDG